MSLMWVGVNCEWLTKIVGSCDSTKCYLLIFGPEAIKKEFKFINMEGVECLRNIRTVWRLDPTHDLTHRHPPHFALQVVRLSTRDHGPYIQAPIPCPRTFQSIWSTLVEFCHRHRQWQPNPTSSSLTKPRRSHWDLLSVVQSNWHPQECLRRKWGHPLTSPAADGPTISSMNCWMYSHHLFQ